MKLTVKLKVTVVIIALVTWSTSSFAQVKTIMYVMKNGEVVFQSPVSGIDEVTFDKASPEDALIVYKNESLPAEKILLDNIRQLSLSDEILSVETENSKEEYAFGDIVKLAFGDITTGINDPVTQSGCDVLLSATPEGDVTVKSPVFINSLTLFGIDGKMISSQHCNSEEVHISIQNNAAGVYLLRVETEQGIVVKKIVKPLNR